MTTSAPVFRAILRLPVNVLAYLTAAGTAALTGQAAPSLLPATAYLPPSPP